MAFIENIDNYIIKKEEYDEDYMNEYNFDDTNTICVKAGMGIGKTKKLENLFKKYEEKKIVIVSFRIKLDKEYIRKFNNFTLYSDIKSNIYDTDEYNRLVVQIDSFYRIRGKIDLLVLDEFTYTSMHLIERVKYKEPVFNTLLEYIRDQNNKIIIMDALLDVYTIKWFSKENRRIKYIENFHKKHRDKIVYNYSNKLGIFMDEILGNLNNNKKIIIPTNSKNFLHNLELKIKSKMSHIKYKFLDSDNSDDINTDDWNKYDIVGYTPTIVAGVSYEHYHFHKCFGYFVNSSASAEMALQQLFRVRNIEDREIHLCIENKENVNYPTKINEIEKYIIDKSSCLVDGAMGIKLSRINKNITKDSYFYLYLNCQIRIFRSKNKYEETLLKLLRKQGIYNIKKVNKFDLEKDKNARKELKNTSKLFKDDQINDIINSEEMDDEEYYLLKNKTNLSYTDKNRLKKKKFRIVYNYNDDISIDIYKKYNNKYLQYKNINICYTLEDDLIKYLKNNIEIIEKNKIEKNEMVDKEEINSDFKLLSANPFVMHQTKSYEKFIIGMELLKVLGINSIFKVESFDIDFKKLSEYIFRKEYIIRLLFKCKDFDINEISSDDKGFNDILKYINSRLRTLFNIYIKKEKDGKYKIYNTDFWCKEINPLNKNENLKMEFMISNMFTDNDISLDDI